jgi:hypothetical protein
MIHLGHVTRQRNLIAPLRQIQIEPRYEDEYANQDRNEKDQTT